MTKELIKQMLLREDYPRGLMYDNLDKEFLAILLTPKITQERYKRFVESKTLIQFVDSIDLIGEELNSINDNQLILKVNDFLYIHYDYITDSLILSYDSKARYVLKTIEIRRVYGVVTYTSVYVALLRLLEDFDYLSELVVANCTDYIRKISGDSKEEDLEQYIEEIEYPSNHSFTAVIHYDNTYDLAVLGTIINGVDMTVNLKDRGVITIRIKAPTLCESDIIYLAMYIIGKNKTYRKDIVFEEGEDVTVKSLLPV